MDDCLTLVGRVRAALNKAIHNAVPRNEGSVILEHDGGIGVHEIDVVQDKGTRRAGCAVAGERCDHTILDIVEDTVLKHHAASGRDLVSLTKVVSNSAIVDRYILI